MSKFYSEAVYVVAGAKRPFHNKKDALYYCADNHIDPKRMEKYDSNKEYIRFLELCQSLNAGKIKHLRRQVAYEIIPEHYEMLHVRDRVVKTYWVSGVKFSTRKEAAAFCEAEGLKKSCITSYDTLEPVMKKNVIEQRAIYTADFVYEDVATGKTIVEDVKSEYTRKEKDYILRRKLMLHVHGIRIKET